MPAKAGTVNKPLPDFAQPETLDEAEERRRELTFDVQNIQSQLGDKNRTDKNGKPLSSKQYWAWKKKAQHMLNLKLDELRFIKKWIQKHRFDIEHPKVEVLNAPVIEDALGHLSSVCGVLESLGEEVDLEAEERERLDAARAFLRRAGVQQPAA